jgi:hypothetical protein
MYLITVTGEKANNYQGPTILTVFDGENKFE